jgi:hypothetical protein
MMRAKEGSVGERRALRLTTNRLAREGGGAVERACLARRRAWGAAGSRRSEWPRAAGCGQIAHQPRALLPMESERTSCVSAGPLSEAAPSSSRLRRARRENDRGSHAHHMLLFAQPFPSHLRARGSLLGPSRTSSKKGAQARTRLRVSGGWGLVRLTAPSPNPRRSVGQAPGRPWGWLKASKRSPLRYVPPPSLKMKPRQSRSLRPLPPFAPQAPRRRPSPSCLRSAG